MRIPKPQDNLNKVLEDSWHELSTMKPEDIAKRADCDFSDEIIRFSHLGSACEVRVRERLVLLDGKEQNPFRSVIVVHYLIGAKEVSLTGNLISFRELWGGDIYYAAFASRAIKPLADHFGPAPEKLVEAGKFLKARVLGMGDASIELAAFPRIPLIFVVWGGDEELPHSANVLFDSTVTEHLPTEDVTVLSSLAVGRLIAARKESDGKTRSH
jgi:hypothetical protein